MEKQSGLADRVLCGGAACGCNAKEGRPVTRALSNLNNQNQDGVPGEIRALRAIVLNLFYELANGEEITVERMKEIIARADAKKSQGGNGDGGAER